jgi:hypothetical protein
LGFRGLDARDRQVQASSEVSRRQCSSVCRRTLACNTAACHHRPALVRAEERRGSTLVQFAHRARPTRSATDPLRRIVTEVSPLKAFYRVADSGSPRKVQWTRDSVYRFRGSSPTPGLTNPAAPVPLLAGVQEYRKHCPRLSMVNFCTLFGPHSPSRTGPQGNVLERRINGLARLSHSRGIFGAGATLTPVPAMRTFRKQQSEDLPSVQTARNLAAAYSLNSGSHYRSWSWLPAAR